MIEITSKGVPFETENAAKAAATRRLQEPDVVSARALEIEGGWAVDVVRQGPELAGRKRKRTNYEGLMDPTYIPSELLEKGYEYYLARHDDARWANRIRQLEDMDWEPVPDKKGFSVGREGTPGTSTRFGSAVTLPMGAGATGVLMRKPTAWCEEDKKKKQEWKEKRRAGMLVSQAKDQKGQPFVGKLEDKGEVLYDNYTETRGR